MINIQDIKIMNDSLINYYKSNSTKNEKKVLKHESIKQILNIENCFNKIEKKEAIKILQDIGISNENLELVYTSLIK